MRLYIPLLNRIFFITGQRTYKLSSKAFQGLGITQIVIALITIMCQVAAVAVYEQVTFSGVGFYCPVIVSDYFSIIIKQKPIFSQVFALSRNPKYSWTFALFVERICSIH